MSHGRTDRELSSSPSDDKVEWAIAELMDVLAERADDPHAQAALQTLRDAFTVARKRASIDPLTGLMNRASFDRVLPEALARAARTQSELALLFMDLDGFKSVNDKNGHPAGDSLLKEVARRVTSSVREDDLLARYGGDEFVVLLESFADRGVISAIAARIIDTLSAPLSVEGIDVQLSVSIGVALFPDHAHDAKELVLRADAAMYWAKHEGGDRYIVWREESDDQSGSYARFETSQRSTVATGMPLRRA
jgi:diguanylate cyclase (GGDEF)-like protein